MAAFYVQNFTFGARVSLGVKIRATELEFAPVNNNVLTLSPASGRSNGGVGQLSDTASQGLILFGKIIWLLLLISLFALSFIVWIWIASFRGGWRFWSWATSRPHPQQVSIGLFYGLIILAISPFFLFVDWTQKQFDRVLPEWMKLPAQVPFRQLFEQRLGITLGEELPFFLDKDID